MTEELDPAANRKKAEGEYAAGVTRVTSRPALLTIETTSFCNLRCVMCPQSVHTLGRPRHLPPETLEKLAPFLRVADTVQLHGIGEPLASASFWAALKHLQPGCQSSINSNFTLATEEKLVQLVESNLGWVNLSLDAATPQTYLRLRGVRLDKVLNNIRRLNALKRERGKTNPRLFLNMTLMRENIDEVVRFIELAAELEAERVYLWHLNRWPEEEMKKFHFVRGDWEFDYSSQGLWNHKALSNRRLREAVARGREVGVEVFLESGGRSSLFTDVEEEEEVQAA